MKTTHVLLCALMASSPALVLRADPPSQGVSVTGGTVTGGSATGGSATGGSVTGGTVTSGSSTSTITTTGTATSGTATAGTVTPGTATATINGREIRVTAPGSVSINSSGDTAQITLAQQSLTAGPTSLRLGGKELAALPASTRKIEVTLEKDMLSVKGDGKEIARAKLDGR